MAQDLVAMQRVSAAMAAEARRALEARLQGHRFNIGGSQPMLWTFGRTLWRRVAGHTTGAYAISKWTDADLRTLKAIADRLNIGGANLLLVLYSESALDPVSAAKNSSGYPIAVGLNQITAVLNAGLGLTEEQRLDMVNWSVAEQLPYVERSLSSTRVQDFNVPDAGGLYVANFAPARMKRGFGGEVVLYDSQQDPGAYQANKGADTEKKGWINVENMRQALRKNQGHLAFLAALKRYHDVTGDPNPPNILPPPSPESPSVLPWVFGGLGLAVVAGVGVVAWKRRHRR